MQVYFQYIEHDFSIADCTCFILMQEHDIPAAFTFDDDYKIYTYNKGNQKMQFWKLPEMLDSYVELGGIR
jgi:predicted nucleic acid-binding protein